VHTSEKAQHCINYCDDFKSILVKTSKQERLQDVMKFADRFLTYPYFGEYVLEAVGV